MFEITYSQVFIFITVLWIVVRILVGIGHKHVDWKQEAKLLLVYVCFIVIARIVYFPWHHVNGHIGTLPFDAGKILPFWTNFKPGVFLRDKYDGWQMNILGNVTMFIPVGIFWPICFKKLDNVAKTVLAGAGLTVFIELTQLLFYDRCSDIDDIILNTIGVLIGALLYFGIAGIIKRKRKR